MVDLKKVHEELIEFAKKYPFIYSVWGGYPMDVDECMGVDDYDPKEFPFYYFFIPGYRFNNDFEDKVTDLSLKICRELDFDCELIVLPSEGDASEYGFLEDCIYSRGS